MKHESISSFVELCFIFKIWRWCWFHHSRNLQNQKNTQNLVDVDYGMPENVNPLKRKPWSWQQPRRQFLRPSRMIKVIESREEVLRESWSKTNDCCLMEKLVKKKADPQIQCPRIIFFDFPCKLSLVMWVLPKIIVPPNHPFVHRVFHYFHHPFWGKNPPIFGSTPMWIWPRDLRKWWAFITRIRESRVLVVTDLVGCLGGGEKNAKVVVLLREVVVLRW